MARTISSCARRTASTGVRGRRGRHVSRRLAVARRAGQRHQHQVQRARRADLSDLREAGALLAASADFGTAIRIVAVKAKVIYRCTPQWFIAMDKPLPHSRREAGASSGGRMRAAANPALERRQADAARARDERDRRDALRAREGPQPPRLDGRGRPDWVISRQRAWGVPIALFVDRKTGELLRRSARSTRASSRPSATGGVDAWYAENAAAFLGKGRNPDDYEMVTDILDVWFDSGSHPRLRRSRAATGPRSAGRADLYVEGSDQHRGWFQSSLLESCGTRGRAPFDAVLTHGFTMDSKGMKMSKSLGNTVSPLDLMKEYGADILRLWALSVDFTEDHRIGKEILAGVADQYRKLRNTFRYLLGALDGFSDEERLDDVAGLSRARALHAPPHGRARRRSCAMRSMISTSTPTSAR